MRRRIDPVDRRILKAMQFDARIANQDLAAVVALSPSACLARVRRLETEGVIKRYLLDIDDLGLGVSWMTFWVELVLTPEGRAARMRLEESFAAARAIVEARQVIGRGDYLIKVVERDVSAWLHLLHHLDPEGRFILSSAVQIDVGVAKSFAGLPQLEA